MTFLWNYLIRKIDKTSATGRNKINLQKQQNLCTQCIQKTSWI